MLVNFILCAFVLNFFGTSWAYFAPSRYATRVSTTFRAAPTSAAEYDSLIKNVSKNTPAGSVIVIKYGGHAMENEELKRSFCEDIAALCRVR
jgi:hypothetical protein